MSENQNRNNNIDHNQDGENHDVESQEEDYSQELNINAQNQYRHYQPLTEKQLQNQLNVFFNLFLNPLLVFGCLAIVVLESTQIVYYSNLIKQIFLNSTLIFYFLISSSYCFAFIKGFKQGIYDWKTMRIINYIGFFFIIIEVGVLVFNGIFIGIYQDMRQSRMMITFLGLFQFTHITIHNLYSSLDIYHSKIYNRLYFLVIPLSEYEKDNAFASISQLYMKLTFINQPLPVIYFFMQAVFQLYMYIWTPSIPSDQLDQKNDSFYLWVVVDQMRNIQIFSIFLIFGFIFIKCFRFLGVHHDHQMRLPHILILLFYTTYAMTYKNYLSTLILNGEWSNIKKVLLPICILTLVPFFCSLFFKRALIKLYRLPLNDQGQMQQQQIELFSQYKLEFQRNLPDAPNYVVQLQKKQTIMYKVVFYELSTIYLVLFIYGFVNINQLYSKHIQESIGIKIQQTYECINELTALIVIIHSLVFQSFIFICESILNSTEYGIFSFLFIANYLIKLQWNVIILLSMFIITSYIVNFTDEETKFQIGPCFSVLLVLIMYYLNQRKVPKEVYEFAKAVKIQFHFGQARNDQQQQSQIENTYETNFSEGINQINDNQQQINQNNINSQNINEQNNNQSNNNQQNINQPNNGQNSSIVQINNNLNQIR